MMRGPHERRTQRARALRAKQPSAESRLWSRLRARRLNGFKFVRQQPVGQYFTDFCCREEMLIVEVDGATHSTDAEIAHDARRETLLRTHGYRILRVLNADVYENLDGVLETILAALERRDAWRFPLSPLAGRGPFRPPGMAAADITEISCAAALDADEM